MTPKIHAWAAALLFAALIPPPSSARAQSPAATAPILLGMSVPLTGTQALQGEELAAGAAACLLRANQQGGVNGRPLQLKVLDDGGQDARTLDNTRTLIEAGVVGLVGYLNLDGTAAALPLLQQVRTPLIGVANGAESLRAGEGGPAFHVRAGYREETEAIVVQLDHMGLDRIAVVHGDDSLGRDGRAGAEAQLSRLALRPSAVVPIEPGEGNVTAAAALLADSRPQAVILAVGHRSAAQLVRAVHQRGVFPRFIAISQGGSDALARELGPLGRGVGLSQVMPYPWSEVHPLVRDYQAALRSVGSRAPGYYGLEGCVYAKVAVEALRRTGREPTRERLLQALEQGEFDLGGFRVRFTARDRRGSRFTDMTVIGADGRILR